MVMSDVGCRMSTLNDAMLYFFVPAVLYECRCFQVDRALRTLCTARVCSLVRSFNVKTGYGENDKKHFL